MQQGIPVAQEKPAEICGFSRYQAGYGKCRSGVRSGSNHFLHQ
jgi:hypothetical protein